MALEATLEATADSDRVVFHFTVANAGTGAVVLEFSDACRAEVVVFEPESPAHHETGRERWRYTDGRAFAQVLASERLDPGAERTYEIVWSEPPSGRFAAVAELRARNRSCTARTTVTVE